MGAEQIPLLINYPHYVVAGGATIVVVFDQGLTVVTTVFDMRLSTIRAIKWQLIFRETFVVGVQQNFTKNCQMRNFHRGQRFQFNVYTELSKYET